MVVSALVNQLSLGVLAGLLGGCRDFAKRVHVCGHLRAAPVWTDDFYIADKDCTVEAEGSVPHPQPTQDPQRTSGS